jgi:putative ABC transport system substrate-binding protein
MIDRRVFLTAVGVAIAAVPFVSEGQQVRNRRVVGVLMGGSESGSQPRLEVFKNGLRDFGWVEGQSIALEYRYANDNYARLPALVAELVRLNVSIIVTNGTPASLAAKNGTAVIPIVMFETADPVGSRLVSSLAKPGGNVTGVAQLVSAELFGKQVQMLKEVLPQLSRLGLLFNPANPIQRSALRWTQVAGQGLGISVQSLTVEDFSELETKVTTATRDGAGALLVTRDNIFVEHLAAVVDVIARHRLPTMYGSRPFATAGGLIAYGPEPSDMALRAAAYVDKILKGAKPAELPVEQPTRFELVINLKTAKTLGLTIPQSVLARADRVIQ